MATWPGGYYIAAGGGGGFGYIIACEEFNFSSGVTNGGSRSPAATDGVSEHENLWVWQQQRSLVRHSLRQGHFVECTGYNQPTVSLTTLTAGGNRFARLTCGQEEAALTLDMDAASATPFALFSGIGVVAVVLSSPPCCCRRRLPIDTRQQTATRHSERERSEHKPKPPRHSRVVPSFPQRLLQTAATQAGKSTR
ncbi:hypothetical protein CDAR_506341 [Caerostris darwini]|uniref:Uncharacterized protein n=1 Tax=Caerostris darwini TaxID=1538125 RepID=A0AAV4V1Y4_9ARAC|nr:hypothetical protein CDAR_506341 [Caerostris darwini]